MENGENNFGPSSTPNIIINNTQEFIFLANHFICYLKALFHKVTSPIIRIDTHNDFYVGDKEIHHDISSLTSNISSFLSSLSPSDPLSTQSLYYVLLFQLLVQEKNIIAIRSSKYTMSLEKSLNNFFPLSKSSKIPIDIISGCGTRWVLIITKDPSSHRKDIHDKIQKLVSNSRSSPVLHQHPEVHIFFSTPLSASSLEDYSALGAFIHDPSRFHIGNTLEHYKALEFPNPSSPASPEDRAAFLQDVKEASLLLQWKSHARTISPLLFNRDDSQVPRFLSQVICLYADCTLLLALISDMCHCKRAKEIYYLHPSLSKQAEKERENPLSAYLSPLLYGEDGSQRPLVVTRETLEEFHFIVSTLANSSEIRRMQRNLRFVEGLSIRENAISTSPVDVLPVCPSLLASNIPFPSTSLEKSERQQSSDGDCACQCNCRMGCDIPLVIHVQSEGKVSERIGLIIEQKEAKSKDKLNGIWKTIGYADHYKGLLLTANFSVMNSFYSQGIQIAAFIFSERSLVAKRAFYSYKLLLELVSIEGAGEEKERYNREVKEEEKGSEEGLRRERERRIKGAKEHYWDRLSAISREVTESSLKTAIDYSMNYEGVDQVEQRFKRCLSVGADILTR